MLYGTVVLRDVMKKKGRGILGQMCLFLGESQPTLGSGKSCRKGMYYNWTTVSQMHFTTEFASITFFVVFVGGGVHCV